MKTIKAILIIIFATQTSCSNFDILPSPNPPSIIIIGITPTLAPIFQKKLDDCANQTPGMGMVLEIIPRSSLLQADADITIQIMDSMEGIGEAYQIGSEEILLISNPDLKIQELTRDNFREAFSSPRTPYNIFSYPENHELENLFVQLFEIDEITPYAIIVPDPTALLEVIVNNKNALGYLPGSWYSGEVPSVNISDIFEENLTLPVLASTKTIPQGTLRSFIGCLQRESQIP